MACFQDLSTLVSKQLCHRGCIKMSDMAPAVPSLQAVLTLTVRASTSWRAELPILSCARRPLGACPRADSDSEGLGWSMTRFMSDKLPVISVLWFMNHTWENQAAESLTVTFKNVVMERKGQTSAKCLVEICPPFWIILSILLQLFSESWGHYTLSQEIYFPKKNI